MTRYRAWLYGVVNDLRKPLNKDKYRVLVRSLYWALSW